MPDRNYFTDEPVVQCDVLVVKKYFCALLEIKMQMVSNKLWCEYLTEFLELILCA